LVEVTIYYMDIRAFGKGFEQFYQNAKAMGIEFVRAKVAKITEDQDRNPIVRIEVTDEDGRVEERVYDMVVLSLGMVPSSGGNGWVPTSPDDGFVRCPQPKLAPCRTQEEGIFVAGTAAGPKDIPDSIVEAGTAAVEAAVYLRRNGREGRQAGDGADLPVQAVAAGHPDETDSP
jgi:heterodisulfide reductase subunit A